MISLLLVKEWDSDWFRYDELIPELRRLSVRVCVVHEIEPTLKHRLWGMGLPVRVLCMNPIRRFRPAWAEIWEQKNMGKIEEYRRLESAGIPVPKWVGVYPGEMPDLNGFKDYVVVKPSLGGRGSFVRIMKRTRVQYRPIRTEAMYNELSPALIAQEYIHTGSRPVSYRVGTIFGEPYHMFRATQSASKPAIDGRCSVGSAEAVNGDQAIHTSQRGFAGKTIVASAKGCHYDQEIPQDVIDLASRAHDAFPDVPMLGTDIIREEATGKLYVLEVNAMGRTFNLAHAAVKNYREQFGFDLERQFGGIRAVARGIRQRLLRENNERLTAVENQGALCQVA